MSTPSRPPDDSNASNRSPESKQLSGGTVGTGMQKFTLSITPCLPIGDLTKEPQLQNLPTAFLEIHPSAVPCISGIPLLAKLSSDEMGTCYYGIQPGLDLEVMVRVFPPALIRQEQTFEALKNATQLAIKVKSDHMIEVNSLAMENDIHFMITDFVRGWSAQEYLQAVLASGQKGLFETSALEICIAATKGLVTAHRHGIHKGHVQPKDILIPEAPSNSDQPFDLLFKESKLQNLGIQLELPSDKDQHRASADLFYMGITLYTLLAGQEPFKPDNGLENFFANKPTPFPPIHTIRPDVSKQTEKVIDGCLGCFSQNPTPPFPDATALSEALQACRSSLQETQSEEVAREIISAQPVLTKAFSFRQAKGASAISSVDSNNLPSDLPRPGSPAVQNSTLTIGKAGGGLILITFVIIIALAFGSSIVAIWKPALIKPIETTEAAVLKRTLDTIRHGDWSNEEDVVQFMKTLVTLKAKESNRTPQERRALLELTAELDWHLNILKQRHVDMAGLLMEFEAISETDPDAAFEKLDDIEVIGCEDEARQLPELLTALSPSLPKLREKLSARVSKMEQEAFSKKLAEAQVLLNQKLWAKALAAFKEASDLQPQELQEKELEDGLRAAREGLAGGK